MPKRKKILILGADGFLGSNLAKSLQKENKYKIIAFDLFKDGIGRNLSDFNQNFVMTQGNFLNRDDLQNALKDVDYVFHFISLTTPGSSMNDPLIEIDTNIRATIVLLEECAKAGIKRIVFSSSGGGIYGDQSKEIYNEKDKTNPISPYAISKLVVENFLVYYKRHHNLDYLILRYSNPYGPGQNLVGSQGIIPIFLNLIRQGQVITVFGDGENIRDYIYINDLVNITKMIFKKKNRYNIYNVGSGIGESINEVVLVMQKITGEKVKIKKMPPRDIDVKKVCLDNRRVVEETKYKNFTPLRKGIKKTWEWILIQKA